MSNFAVRFCLSCGTQLTQRLIFGKQRPVCPACGWTHFDDPKVASAVLVEKDGKVLLVRRVNEPYLGYWSLPAGFIDAGEDPAKAAERECLEETGLIVKVVTLKEIIFGREHPRGADFIIIYEAEVIGGRLHAGDDADEAAFFSYENLPPLAFHSTRKVLRQNS